MVQITLSSLDLKNSTILVAKTNATCTTAAAFIIFKDYKGKLRCEYYLIQATRYPQLKLSKHLNFNDALNFWKDVLICKEDQPIVLVDSGREEWDTWTRVNFHEVQLDRKKRKFEDIELLVIEEQEARPNNSWHAFGKSSHPLEAIIDTLVEHEDTSAFKEKLNNFQDNLVSSFQRVVP